VLELILAASATAIATGVGVIPVAVLGDRAAALRPFLLGIAAGVMAVASVIGLIVPGLDDGTPAEVWGGVLIGIAFLFVARRLIDRYHEHGALPGQGAVEGGHSAAVPGVADGPQSQGVRTSLLVFLVLFVHSLPEGFAIGAVYASDTAGLSLFVITAIAIHNIPEGTSIAVPMSQAGYGFGRQFWAAVGTSIPQPIGAVIAYLLVEQVAALLPISLGFAAGAMLALVVVELVPQGWKEGRRGVVIGFVAGAIAMVLLGQLLEVD
jgi:zinc transporter, ZIP family